VVVYESLHAAAVFAATSGRMMQLCSTLSRKNASDSVDNSFAVVFETFNAAPAEKIRH
jgi:hypothetical protein